MSDVRSSVKFGCSTFDVRCTSARRSKIRKLELCCETGGAEKKNFIDKLVYALFDHNDSFFISFFLMSESYILTLEIHIFSVNTKKPFWVCLEFELKKVVLKLPLIIAFSNQI